MKQAPETGFQRRLAEAMRANGMNQPRLALASGVAQGLISKYVNGRLPEADKLARLADALAVSMNWLWSGHDAPCRLDPAELPQPVVRFAGSLGGAGMAAEAAAEYGLRLEEFSAVPLVADSVAAGAPVVVRDQVEDWVLVFAPLLGKRKNLVAVRVRGDSMDPVLADGSVVVVDRDDRRIVRRRPYVVRVDSACTVKYVAREGHELVLIPENREHREQRVPVLEGEAEPIVGRVVWSWRAWT